MDISVSNSLIVSQIHYSVQEIQTHMQVHQFLYQCAMAVCCSNVCIFEWSYLATYYLFCLILDYVVCDTIIGIILVELLTDIEFIIKSMYDIGIIVVIIAGNAVAEAEFNDYQIVRAFIVVLSNSHDIAYIIKNY